ncbi:MAG: CinA family protein [Candidatus Hermodarchaeota archaeon]
MNILEKIENIVKKLTEKNKLITIAESCTGGYISHMITNISGSSKIFERGVISYSNQSKSDILKVDPNIIAKHGAVSEEVAKQMAEGIRKNSEVCDLGIGITGIAGPKGGTPNKPVGLVYIGYSTVKETIVKKYNFKADRIRFKELVLEEVIKYLETYINQII